MFLTMQLYHFKIQALFLCAAGPDKTTEAAVSNLYRHAADCQLRSPPTPPPLLLIPPFTAAVLDAVTVIAALWNVFRAAKLVLLHQACFCEEMGKSGRLGAHDSLEAWEKQTNEWRVVVWAGNCGDRAGMGWGYRADPYDHLMWRGKEVVRIQNSSMCLCAIV